MNSSPFHRIARSQRAFTLIELLVVIAIIAILAGLLLPVVNQVMIKARSVDTKNTAIQLLASIKNYQTEYGTYPLPSARVTAMGATPTDYTYLDTASNAELIQVLQATNDPTKDTSNARRIRYFEYRDAKSVTAPKGGLVPAAAGTTAKDSHGNALTVSDLVDSFGNRYLIRIDTGYTDNVLNPYVEGNPSATSNDTGGETASQVLRVGAIVWSYGPNGKIDKASYPSSVGDDILSWQ